MRNHKTCTIRAPEAYLCTAQKMEESRIHCLVIVSSTFSKMGTECSPENEMSIRHRFWVCANVIWACIMCIFNFFYIFMKSEYVTFTVARGTRAFRVLKKYSFCCLLYKPYVVCSTLCSYLKPGWSPEHPADGKCTEMLHFLHKVGLKLQSVCCDFMRNVIIC